MSTPSATPAPQGGPKKPVVVVPTGMTRRDMMLAGAIVVGVLGFVAGAIYSTGTEKHKKVVKGVVRGHSGTGTREREISLAYKDGRMDSKTVDTGWYLKVFVEKENREYDVMVEKDVWDARKVGDTLEFLRPPSEQR